MFEAVVYNIGSSFVRSSYIKFVQKQLQRSATVQMFVYWQTISKIAKYFSQELFLIVADHWVSPANLQLTQSADFDEIF